LYNILIEFGVPMKLVRLIKVCLNEIYSKVRIGKCLCSSFPIQNGLKQRNMLSPLFFNFALEYAIGKVQEIQVGLKLNRTHQLAYADDMNLLGNNIDRYKHTHTHIYIYTHIYVVFFNSMTITFSQNSCLKHQ
jgi:hypothetical protein